MISFQQSIENQYRKEELKREYAFIASRGKLGKWKEEDAPDVETCIGRIDWLLNGTYGAGAQFYAEDIIENNLRGKVGKNIEKAWLTIGANIVMLIALHDTTEYTFSKITEVWKKQGINFPDVNKLATYEIKSYIESNKESE